MDTSLSSETSMTSSRAQIVEFRTVDDLVLTMKEMRSAGGVGMAHVIAAEADGGLVR